MAYNMYRDVNAIYQLKGQWDKANKANDENGKNRAAKEATQYYDSLRANGYGDVADELKSKDYAASKAVDDYWGKLGRTATRPYFYSLGKSRGMSKEQIDNLISYDDYTNEVSFGGKKIGKPDAIIDGTSYWDKPEILDNAFNNFLERSGTTRDKATAVNQENESLFRKYEKEYDDLKNTNPFTTEEAKFILSKYDLSGLQGRDNEAAKAAGSNGGNIDSYAAANALRQQAALVNMGKQAVLDSYQQKLDHARNLLSDMGVNIDRVYNQEETSKNNDTARKSEVASVTGYTPVEWSIQNDPLLKNFVDENGQFKSEYNNIDFQELINNAKEKGNTDLAKKYAILRGLKIYGNLNQFGKYLNEGDIEFIEPQRTADYELTKYQTDSGERIANAGYDTDKAINDANNQNAIDQIYANGEVSQNLTQQQHDNTMEETAFAAQLSNNLGGGASSGNNSSGSKSSSSSGSGSKASSSSGSGSKSSSSSGSESKAPLSDDQVERFANKINEYVKKNYSDSYGKDFYVLEKTGTSTYKVINDGGSYIASKIAESSYSKEQKDYLIKKFGITQDQVNNVLKH